MSYIYIYTVVVYDIYVYIYIYICICPRSLSFAGDHNGVGWGGVGDGMITFLAHVHIFDATPVWQSLYGDHGGVGW